jgi:cytochrome c-type biogenesis protein CcmH
MRQRGALFLLLSIVVLVAALWSFLSLNAATHKTLDQRVQEVGAQLKCPVCQGESVADSPSLLAQQMRGSIRKQLEQGKSEQEVIQYFVNSYGPGIVWTPQWQGFTLFAWLVPIVLLLGGIGLLWLTLREWRASVPASTNEDTQTSSDDAELEPYRAQLEQELANEDALFRHLGTEGR